MWVLEYGYPEQVRYISCLQLDPLLGGYAEALALRSAYLVALNMLGLPCHPVHQHYRVAMLRYAVTVTSAVVKTILSKKKSKREAPALRVQGPFTGAMAVQQVATRLASKAHLGKATRNRTVTVSRTRSGWRLTLRGRKAHPHCGCPRAQGCMEEGATTTVVPEG